MHTFAAYALLLDGLCLLFHVNSICTPDRTRTCNRLLRRQMLYPVELRALGVPDLGSVVGSVQCGSHKAFNSTSRMRRILPVAVTVCSLLSVVFVQRGTVLLRCTGLPVLGVFFLVVSFHTANITMLGRWDLNPRLPVYKTDALTN